jgi:HD superfamily phosphohydrolase
MDDAGIRRWRKVIRLAALLHDVGHAPFSHAGEDLLPKMPESERRFKHEDYSIAIIKECFRDIIETHAINNNYGIKVDEVTALLGDLSVKSTALSLLWKELISGQLDADRADYLLRDSIHLGVSYGIYDRNRLTRCMVLGTSETGAPIVAVQDKGWHIAESLVIARYQMFSQVYFHKTRRIYDYHLYKATKKILLHHRLKDGCYPNPTDIAGYLKFDDWFMFGELSIGHGGEHGDIINKRNHYKCVFETGMLPTPEEEVLINEKKDELKCENAKIFFDDKATTSWYKQERDICIFGKNSNKSRPLSAESKIVKSMISVPELKRLYIER